MSLISKKNRNLKQQKARYLTNYQINQSATSRVRTDLSICLTCIMILKELQKFCQTTIMKLIQIQMLVYIIITTLKARQTIHHVILKSCGKMSNRCCSNANIAKKLYLLKSIIAKCTRQK